MTESQAAQLIGGLMAAYRTSNNVTADTFDAYVEDIVDLDFQAAAIAIKTLRQTSKFLPAISEIRQAAAKITNPPIPDADEAWGEVQANIRQHGWCGKPDWSHPAVQATVAAMGWMELCASTNQAADRAHFLKLYDSRRNRLELQQSVSPELNQLAGLVGPAAMAELTAPEGGSRG